MPSTHTGAQLNHEIPVVDTEFSWSFWATHQGAELDLLVGRGDKKYGCEIKRTSSPTMTRSMHIALRDLGLRSLTVVHAGRHSFPIQDRVRAVAVDRLLDELEPL